MGKIEGDEIISSFSADRKSAFAISMSLACHRLLFEKYLLTLQALEILVGARRFELPTPTTPFRRALAVIP